MPPTTTAPVLELDKWEYEPYNGTSKNYYQLTKYTGNASHIIIPAKINGKPVTRIIKGAIANKSNVKQITFQSDSVQPYLWIDSGCIQNLSSLTTVNMPITDLGIYDHFATGCYKLRTINVDNWQYKFVDGALYYYNSKNWEIRYYCPGYPSDELIVQSWCKGFHSCNLEEAVNLKTIRLHKDVNGFPSVFSFNRALENIYVDAGNPVAISVNGVLYTKNSSGNYTDSLYPMGNKSKTHTIPPNALLHIFGDNYVNNYLETLYIPTGSTLQADIVQLHKYFPKLKTIYIQNGHTQYSKIKAQFPGDVILY